MSEYLVMCLFSYCAATIAGIANLQYGPPAAIALLIAMGFM